MSPLIIYPLTETLPKKGGLKIYPIAATFHADTLAWRDRSVAAGGLVEDADSTALNPFVEGIYNLGLRSSSGTNTLIEFLPFVGGNLVSALTKLWFPASAPNVTNFNFVEGSYSRATGLTGNGTSTYLNSNVNLATIGVVDSLSVGLYKRTTGGFNAIEIGGETESRRMVLHSHWSDNNLYFDAFEQGNGRTTISLVESSKTIIATRYSSTNVKIYKDGLQVGATNNVNSSSLPPNTVINYFCLQSNGITSFFSPRSIGCIFISNPAIPENKVVAFTTLVNDLMTALGRGV